jgi:hypothetical protein
MQLAVTGRRSEKRTDQTHRSGWPDASGHYRTSVNNARQKLPLPWPDALHLASSRSPVSSHRDRTRSIARDRMRRVSGRLYDQFYPSGCLIRRSGSVRDRTRRLETLTLARLTTAENWPDPSGQTVTASGAASGHHSDCRSPLFLFRLPMQ